MRTDPAILAPMVKHKDSKSAKVRQLLKEGKSAAEIAKLLKCTVGLVYNVKSRLGDTPKRGPGRPRKTAASGAAGASGAGLDSILDAVRSSEREREKYRAALQRISAIVAEAIARA